MFGPARFFAIPKRLNPNPGEVIRICGSIHFIEYETGQVIVRRVSDEIGYKSATHPPGVIFREN